ncbi:craniofacial development protein 2-like protein [Tanacetum coccineum]
MREGNSYKLWYSGSSRARNGVGVMLATRLKDNVVQVTKRSDRIMAILVFIDGETVNIISAYAPQVGLSDAVKKRFWDAVDELVREYPTDQRLIIEGDLNGHIGAAADGYERGYGGFGFGVRNEEGSTILKFSTTHDLVRRGDLRACKDCRAFPGEACSLQHRLVIFNALFERQSQRKEARGRLRILWKNLNREAVETFRATVFEKLSALEEDMSASNADQIEEVQTKVAAKQSSFKELLSCREGNQEDIDMDKERYKIAKREVKIAVARAKDKAYDDLYMKLDSKEEANDIYKIAKA